MGTKSKVGAVTQIFAVCVILGATVACSPKPSPETTPATPSASVGTDVDDAVITGKIKAALLANENVKSLDVTVTTSKGHVMLSGFVNNQNQIDLAVGIAKGITGVVQVDNQFTVKEGATTVGANIDDDVITTKVRAALLNDATIKSADISTITRNGEVQLSGFVVNQAQISTALDIAKRTEGVKSVLNHMTVK